MDANNHTGSFAGLLISFKILRVFCSGYTIEYLNLVTIISHCQIEIERIFQIVHENNDSNSVDIS